MTDGIGESGRLYAAGELDRAARICLRLIAASADDFDALHLLGVICTRSGYRADGVAYLERAAARQPDARLLWGNLGAAYGAMQRFDRAEAAYRRALARDGDSPDMLNNLGLALNGLQHGDAALAAFEAALALDPAHDAACFNRARAAAAQGRLAEAETGFRALWDRLTPDTAPDRIASLSSDYARLLMDLGRPEEALAIVRDDRVPAPRWNESLILLLLGRFEEGWAAYEARWDAPNHERAHPDFSVLDLDRVAGKIVLVTGEQGRGDIIQFLRYANPLADRGARVLLMVPEDVRPLAEQMLAVESVVCPEDDMPAYDFRTSMISLPLAFRTRLETIPGETPYLSAPAARIAATRHRLGARTDRKRIGVVWSGSAASHARSAMPAAALGPLLSRHGVECHCLQKEIGRDDQTWLDSHGLVTTHTDALRDFGDTAALIAAMDLVVTIDTAVAHLAGAMGRPVWILLPFDPDWRWLLGRDDSPWYPTARLFRQPSRNDWAGVVDRVLAALPF